MSTMQPLFDNRAREIIAELRKLAEQGVVTKEEALSIFNEMDESMSRQSKTLMEILDQQTDEISGQIGHELLEQFRQRMNREVGIPAEPMVTRTDNAEEAFTFNVAKNRESEPAARVTFTFDAVTGQPSYHMSIDPAAVGEDRTAIGPESIAVREVPKEPEVKAPEPVKVEEPVVEQAECICDGSGWSQADEFDERIPCPRCNPFMH